MTKSLLELYKPEVCWNIRHNYPMPEQPCPRGARLYYNLTFELGYAPTWGYPVPLPDERPETASFYLHNKGGESGREPWVVCHTATGSATPVTGRTRKEALETFRSLTTERLARLLEIAGKVLAGCKEAGYMVPIALSRRPK